MSDPARLAFKTVTSTDLQPYGEYVVIERPRAPSMTQGGLYVPLQAQKKEVVGTVIAVGGGKRDRNGKLMPMDVQVGNKVMFRQYDVFKVRRDGREIVFIKNSELVAILED